MGKQFLIVVIGSVLFVGACAHTDAGRIIPKAIQDNLENLHDEQTRLSIAKDPNATSEALTYLRNDLSEKVLIAVIVHPHTPEAVRLQHLKDASESVRIAVIKSTRDKKVLNSAAASTDVAILEAAVSNKYMDPFDLETTMKTVAKKILTVKRQQKQDYDAKIQAATTVTEKTAYGDFVPNVDSRYNRILEAIAGNSAKRSSTEKALATLDFEEVLVALAKVSKNPKILEKLAGSQYVSVQQAVAGNWHTPIPTLVLLSTSSVEKVRKSAIVTIRKLTD